MSLLRELLESILKNERNLSMGDLRQLAVYLEMEADLMEEEE